MSAERIVIHAEHCIALEIDALDVRAHRVVVQRRTKSKPAVVAAECEEMRLERRALKPGELLAGMFITALDRADHARFTPGL